MVNSGKSLAVVRVLQTIVDWRGGILNKVAGVGELVMSEWRGFNSGGVSLARNVSPIRVWLLRIHLL